jgi:hypothetical protein
LFSFACDLQCLRCEARVAAAQRTSIWSVDNVEALPHACAHACSSKTAARKSRFYELHKVPWTAPSEEQLAALAPLEDTMRATLSSLASFNETERMVLLKQFSFQEKVARQQARSQGLQVYAPQGLLSVSQFVAAWHNLSVKLTKQDACTFFFKYGCDSEGLLPYEVFAMHFLSGQSRLLALAPELAGPYPQGERLLGFARLAACDSAWSSPVRLLVDDIMPGCCSPGTRSQLFGLHISLVIAPSGRHFREEGCIHMQQTMSAAACQYSLVKTRLHYQSKMVCRGPVRLQRQDQVSAVPHTCRSAVELDRSTCAPVSNRQRQCRFVP